MKYISEKYAFLCARYAKPQEHEDPRLSNRRFDRDSSRNALMVQIFPYIYISEIHGSPYRSIPNILHSQKLLSLFENISLQECVTGMFKLMLRWLGG
ncbi:hypothetical protein CEXT_653451 [Caerostris extrusa]|uniref:Uncharacterized protein n=1 Tax=Caerostris extrusa TaxID=172846 RepID=A0AAV4WPF5_CAEEX|nr:hypothetical protein CEXT_653451 [Caerostris extrusa]